MEWTCKQCGQPVDPAIDNCSSCDQPTCIPSNVQRAAQSREALEAEYENVGSEDLDICRDRIQEKIAVSINMHTEALLNLLHNPRLRLANFHDNLAAEAVIDPDPELVAVRKSVDYFLFGADGRTLLFGALNLGTPGLVSYGAACVFVTDDDIKKDTSFLKHNSFNYVRKSNLEDSISIPQVDRALWRHAGTLTALKHAEELHSCQTIERIARLVLRSEGNRKTDLFVEAQISSQVTRGSLAAIILHRGYVRKRQEKDLLARTAELDQQLLKDLEQKMENGVDSMVETVKWRATLVGIPFREVVE